MALFWTTCPASTPFFMHNLLKPLHSSVLSTHLYSSWGGKNHQGAMFGPISFTAVSGISHTHRQIVHRCAARPGTRDSRAQRTIPPAAHARPAGSPVTSNPAPPPASAGATPHTERGLALPRKSPLPVEEQAPVR